MKVDLSKAEVYRALAAILVIISIFAAGLWNLSSSLHSMKQEIIGLGHRMDKVETALRQDKTGSEDLKQMKFEVYALKEQVGYLKAKLEK